MNIVEIRGVLSGNPFPDVGAGVAHYAKRILEVGPDISHVDENVGKGYFDVASKTDMRNQIRWALTRRSGRASGSGCIYGRHSWCMSCKPDLPNPVSPRQRRR